VGDRLGTQIQFVVEFWVASETLVLCDIVKWVGVLAGVLINERLDAGDDLDAIFYDGEEFGYRSFATRVSKAVFQITFGCAAGPLAGDGGECDVAFDPAGRVASIDAGRFWII